MKKQLAWVALIIIAISVLAWQNRYKLAEDILKELGLEKEIAEDFIASNFFGGSLQIYKTDQVMAMSQAKRATLVKAFGDYIRAYVESPAFAVKFEEERKEFMGFDEEEGSLSREEMIQQFLQELKSDESLILQELKAASGAKKTELETALKHVREAQVALKDSKHPLHKKYFDLMKEEMMPEKNSDRYDDPAEAKAAAEAEKKIQDELIKFPETPKQMVKERLKEFIEMSGSVDYNAKIEKRGGTYYFVDEKYEQKDDTWKRMYRCGKEVMMPARAYAQAWLASLK